MGFFGKIWSGIKKIGKFAGNAIRGVGKVINNPITDIIQRTLRKLPVVGQTVGTAFDTAKRVSDTANQAVDVVERIAR